MMKPDNKTILVVMTNLVARKMSEGRAQSADPVRFYGFTPADVSGLHFWKRDANDNVWFRLHDGRVIDADGNLAEADLSHYIRQPDEVSNDEALVM
ncbi:MAG: hypothetical protein PW788_03060 [Micavibrio sp.]|nr:hypothetical protein [Micavibrio sp.]